MADGTYTYTVSGRTPRPRSKRLRECGGYGSASGGSATYVSVGSASSGDSSAAEEAREAAANANSAATNASAAAGSAERAAERANNAATNATTAADGANQAATSATSAAQSANSAATNANAAAEAAYEAIEKLGDLPEIIPITNEEIDELLKGFNFIDSFTVTAKGEYPLTLDAENGADGADITGSVDISEIAEDEIRKAFENG